MFVDLTIFTLSVYGPDDHYLMQCRGTLHLKSLKSSPAMSSFQQVPLPPSNLTSLRLSAKYGGYYFIRARSKFTDLLSEDEADELLEEDHVITFISAVSVVLNQSTNCMGKIIFFFCLFCCLHKPCITANVYVY